MTEQLSARLSTLQNRFFGIGLVGIGAACAGYVSDHHQFYKSYLVAYMFWFGLGIGCLALIMIHHLTKGRWGFVIQRFMEAGARTLPLLALLFIPIVLGIGDLYLWADPEAVKADHFLQHKAPYLNVPFFLGRAAFYFLLWVGFSFFLRRWSSQNDHSPSNKLMARMTLFSGPGVVAYVVTVSFASIDWIMSLDPHWYSTGYGTIFLVGQCLTAFAFSIILLHLLGNEPVLAEVAKMERFWDLGNMMLAFVMLWGYITLTHFLIVWSGNLPEEITWYISRTAHGWEYVVWALVAFHFSLPFMLLLHRRTKKNRYRLSKIALVIIMMRFIELHWLITPSFSHGGADAHHGMGLHWMDAVMPVAMGGLWLGAFCYFLRSQPLLPKNDPVMKEALAHG